MGILKNMWNGGKYLLKTGWNAGVSGVKKGYQWTKDNPQKLGAMMSGVGQVASAFNPIIGTALNIVSVKRIHGELKHLNHIMKALITLIRCITIK